MSKTTSPKLNTAVPKIFQKKTKKKTEKKRKKESPLSIRRENVMQYFFAKSIYVFSSTDIVFAKNPQGLMLSAHFLGVYL